MAKLVAIGDSLTQGFQSGAIFRTDWSFPVMIARSMGLSLKSDFIVPEFVGSGLPLNLEFALQEMAKELGTEVDLREWMIQFPSLLMQFMNKTENLYERGIGSKPVNYEGIYHNLAVWGFRVSDSFQLNSNNAQAEIEQQEGWFQDDFLGLPSGAMYRTAQQVLNPNLQPERMSWTQLNNLRKIVNQEQGKLDNLILWLGSNDCLGTVLELNLNDMAEEEFLLKDDHPVGRRKYNLTDPQIFQQDFQRLIEYVEQIIPHHTQVFVATIAHVTIPPVTTGIPPFDGEYFQYYSRFFAREYNFDPWLHKHITGEEAKKIDQRIDIFNHIIQDLLAAKSNWHIVDICKILDELAVKRNECTDSPELPLKNYYKNQGIDNHPLLQLDPIPSILSLRLEKGKRVGGGLFSLDGVHPSTIGYGIIAEAFLQVMKEKGVADADPRYLNWDDIIAHDTLLQTPPIFWERIIEAAQQNATLWEVLLNTIY
ncbi:MAG: SGNH/GDSL hydrolase family protein [Microcoleaceae cyanobacterium]